MWFCDFQFDHKNIHNTIPKKKYMFCRLCQVSAMGMENAKFQQNNTQLKEQVNSLEVNNKSLSTSVEELKEQANKFRYKNITPFSAQARMF